MERLTRWNEQTEQAELVEYDTEEWKDFKSTLYDLDEHFVSTAMNQLAIYEDTGLEPHQIDAICDQLNALVDEVLEYKTAEEQGLLLRLLCKVGDTVFHRKEYAATFTGIREYQITNIMISQNKKGEWTKKYRAMMLLDGKTIDCPINFAFDDIGKTVFLTKAEAEKALAEMGE